MQLTSLERCLCICSHDDRVLPAVYDTNVLLDTDTAETAVREALAAASQAELTRKDEDDLILKHWEEEWSSGACSPEKSRKNPLCRGAPKTLRSWVLCVLHVSTSKEHRQTIRSTILFVQTGIRGDTGL